MFNELKQDYLAKYQLLESISYNIDCIFTNQKEELDFGENHYLKYFNLSDLEDCIKEISVEIVSILQKEDSQDLIQKDFLCHNQLI